MNNLSGIKAGRAYVTMSLRSDIEKGLRNIERRFYSFGAAVSKIGLSLIALGTTAASSLILPIRYASEAQEVMNKFSVMFSGQEKDVKRWADTLAKEFGRSKVEVAKFLSDSQEVLLPMGIDENQATEMAKQMTKLAYDVASFSNMTDQEAYDRIRGGLLGSHELFIPLGIKITENSLKEEGKKLGFGKEMTEVEKIMTRYSILMNNTSKHQGDVVRSFDSYANQVKRLQGIFADTMVEIGVAIIPWATKIVSTLGDIVKRIGDFAKRYPELTRWFAIISVGVVALGASLLVLSGICYFVGFGFGMLAKSIGLLGKTWKLATGLFSGTLRAIAFAFGMLTNPISLVVVAVGAAAAAFLYFSGTGSKVMDFFKEKLSGMFAFFGATFGAIKNALLAGDLEAAFTVLTTSLNVIWATCLQTMSEAWIGFKHFFMDAWVSTWTAAVTAFESITWGIEAAWTNVITSLKDIWIGFTTVFTQLWKDLTTVVQKAMNLVGEWTPGVFSGDASEMNKKLDADRDTERAKAIDEADRKTTENEIKRQQARAEQDREHAEAMATVAKAWEQEQDRQRDEWDKVQSGLEAAKKDWQDALNRANSLQAPALPAEGDDIQRDENGMVIDDVLDGSYKDKIKGLEEALAVGPAMGTFSGSGAAFAALAGKANGWQKKIVDSTEETAKNTRQLKKKNKLVFKA